MSEPIDLINNRLGELRSQIESGRREADSYVETGNDKHKAVDALEAEAKKFEDFMIQIELDNAERVARSSQVAEDQTKR